MKNTGKWKRTLWILLFLLLVFTPIGILIGGTEPSSSRSPWLDFSDALGYIGLTLMAVQFLLTARIKFIKEPFGSDVIYHFHRQISIATFLLILAHPITLFLVDKRYLYLLNIFQSPLAAKFGLSAVILLILVVISAEYRKKIKIPYTFWKIWHGILTTLVVAVALVHVFLIGSFRYLSYPPVKAIWIAYTAAWLLLLVYTRILYPLKLINNKYRVKTVKEERGASWTITLQPTRKKSFHFKPGQFAWLTIWKTPFSDTEHPFSIASSSEHPEEISFTIKDLGKFTSTIKNMQPGQNVYVDGPHGSFTIDRYPEAKKLIFIAGGIGITPIMSMLRSMADRKDKRPIKFFYNNRDWESVTYREEIAELEKKLDLQVIHTLEKPPQKWNGETGYLTESILQKHLPKSWFQKNTAIFLCGPQVMMDIVIKQCMNLGFDQQQIHYELFDLV